jgi:hypothetical protein
MPSRFILNEFNLVSFVDFGFSPLLSLLRNVVGVQAQLAELSCMCDCWFSVFGG